MASVAIEVEHVTKSFKLYREKSQSAKERVIRAGRNPHQNFKALDDVSFEVAAGETFALLGHNGSGKSTMLKCIAGTLRPNQGRIRVTGRLAALLELGAGFHGDLTGRENIYMNGSILGFSRTQIDRILDDVVEFSELQDFIDMQVKHYSSGMSARLGFAVAINVDPEVLLIDEVLAVGDEAFQRKCIERVKQIKRGGATILLVSHMAELVRQLADRAAVFDHGHMITLAPPGEAIRTLRESLAGRGIQLLGGQATDAEGAPVPQSEILAPQWSGPPSGSVPAVDITKPVQITKVRLEYPDPDARYLLPNQPMRLRIDYLAPERIEDIAVTVEAHDDAGVLVFGFDSDGIGQPIHAVDGVGAVCFDFADVPLLDGTYRLTIMLSTHDGGVVYDRRDQQDQFDVMNPGRQRGLVSSQPKVVHYFTDVISG
ncbi:MAG: transporter ATP-binding protein [Acidimicrobiales bacterium]|nr:transporter ATP-binding protein [Acidimicrobiales bacterium]